jgi:hypothetical protein
LVCCSKKNLATLQGSCRTSGTSIHPSAIQISSAPNSSAEFSADAGPLHRNLKYVFFDWAILVFGYFITNLPMSHSGV